MPMGSHTWADSCDNLMMVVFPLCMKMEPSPPASDPVNKRQQLLGSTQHFANHICCALISHHILALTCRVSKQNRNEGLHPLRSVHWRMWDQASGLSSSARRSHRSCRWKQSHILYQSPQAKQHCRWAAFKNKKQEAPMVFSTFLSKLSANFHPLNLCFLPTVDRLHSMLFPICPLEIKLNSDCEHRHLHHTPSREENTFHSCKCHQSLSKTLWTGKSQTNAPASFMDPRCRGK